MHPIATSAASRRSIAGAAALAGCPRAAFSRGFGLQHSSDCSTGSVARIAALGRRLLAVCRPVVWVLGSRSRRHAGRRVGRRGAAIRARSARRRGLVVLPRVRRVLPRWRRPAGRVGRTAGRCERHCDMWEMHASRCTQHGGRRVAAGLLTLNHTPTSLMLPHGRLWDVQDLKQHCCKQQTHG